MATIQEATQNAMAYARGALGAERTQGLRLEEIESDRVGGSEIWRITLSMMNTDDPGPGFMNTLNMLSNPREYKAFTVLKDTGEVTSMKIRNLSKA